MTEIDLAALIRDVPDFPTEGILFKDVMPLIADPVAFRETIDRLAAWAGPRAPDLILGAEARGFIFGGALAYALGCGFVTARKPGKLPWTTIEAQYDLEYGKDSLEVHTDAIARRRPGRGPRRRARDGRYRCRQDRPRGATRWTRRRGAVRDRVVVSQRPKPASRDRRPRAHRLQLTRFVRPSAYEWECSAAPFTGWRDQRAREAGRWMSTWTRSLPKRRERASARRFSFATA